jgi:hypothetical protein
MVKQDLEVDTVDGQRALLYIRDAAGRDWIAGAILSEPRATDGSGQTRAWPTDEEPITLVGLNLVLP